MDFIYKAPERDWEKVVFNWPLLSSPVPTFIICATYVILVKFIGPSSMRHREPFQIKPLIMVYNVATVFANLYLFISFGRYGWFNNYKFSCQEFDDSQTGHLMNWTSYLFYLSKFADFADTIFFVLTKKNSHITFLHLIHHSLMPCYCYLGMRLGPNGHGAFAPLLNSFVHVIMYSYYTLALLGPSVRPYLWWKKYLTQMQLIQFGLIFLHSAQLYFQLPEPCVYPIHSFYIYTILTTMFTILFANFYIQSYLKVPAKTIGSPAKKECAHDLNQNIVVNGSGGKKIH